MDREKAIEYLDGHWELTDRKFSPEDEQKIQKVMKSGKIFGDPTVILND